MIQRVQNCFGRELCGFTTFLIFISSVGCSMAQEESSVALMARAQRALNQGDDAEAAKLAIQSAESAEENYSILQAAGEVLYRAGRSKESLKYFDQVVKMQPRLAPYNWQRGIALCSVERFKDGAAQFKTHHDVNPDDVENSAWYFLCVAKTEGIEAARKTVIPSRGDGREPMMSVLAMLKEELKPEEVVQAAIDKTQAGAARKRAQFYADLYVALYYDSLNQSEEARRYLERSLKYGDNGYMVDAARVYLKDRFGGPKKSK
ncbi:MAG: hypothetical protein AAGG44_08875 [Planctomycetota bacterium]